MKAILISGLFAITLFGTNTVYGQKFKNMEEKRERVEALKVGFITKQLDLTPEEARSFWPVYNQMQSELQTLRKSRRTAIANAVINYDTMKDSEVETLVDNEIIFRQQELDIRKKYHPQFKTVLPIRKVAKLYRSEEEFKRNLLQEMKKN